MSPSTDFLKSFSSMLAAYFHEDELATTTSYIVSVDGMDLSVYEFSRQGGGLVGIVVYKNSIIGSYLTECFTVQEFLDPDIKTSVYKSHIQSESNILVRFDQLDVDKNAKSIFKDIDGEETRQYACLIIARHYFVENGITVVVKGCLLDSRAVYTDKTMTAVELQSTASDLIGRQVTIWFSQLSVGTVADAFATNEKIDVFCRLTLPEYLRSASARLYLSPSLVFSGTGDDCRLAGIPSISLLDSPPWSGAEPAEILGPV